MKPVRMDVQFLLVQHLLALLHLLPLLSSAVLEPDFHLEKIQTRLIQLEQFNKWIVRGRYLTFG